MELKEKTLELINECKAAGYKHLAIFCESKDVPKR